MMKIDFILNGEDVSVQADPETRLVNILRNTFRLLETKPGCGTGLCGSCSVIFNGAVIKSCLVPAFKIQGREIITIEGFSQTDEYQDILLGFSQAGFESCGFCEKGKILAVEALLGRNKRPSKEEILSTFRGIRCRCNDPEGLVEAVMAVTQHRRRRIYGRTT